MRLKTTLVPLDFLPTLAQRRRREFRRQWRCWAGVAACGALTALAPILHERYRSTAARAQLMAMRSPSEALRGESAAFDMTSRTLATMAAHRRAAVTLIERREPVARRLLDVMLACADGVRLTVVKTGDGQLRVEGYATTQSRVRETQKRLRTLTWVRKVVELESSVVPHSVTRQWAGATNDVAMPNIRRFALRLDLKPMSTTGSSAIDMDAISREEVPDAR